MKLRKSSSGIRQLLFGGWVGVALLIAVSFSVLCPAQDAQAEDGAGPTLEDQRQWYQQAKHELRTGAGPRYKRLRKKLDNYPLAIYLDYEALTDKISRVTPDQAAEFLKRSEGSPLKNRFLAAYLENTGNRRRWDDFLAVAQDAPRDDRLECFYYRARFSKGHKAEAMAAAERLWNIGKSQDKACDPLFAAWMKESGPTDSLVWSRALKAFDSRSSALIKYLERYASSDVVNLLREMADVYRRPDKLVTDAHPGDPFHAQLMTVGIRRLARVNPEQGRQAYLRAEQTQSFTDQQREAIEAMIVKHSLFALSSAPDQWVMETLARLRDDELTEIYLRNQLKLGHWQDVIDGIAWLNPATAQKDEWRYWLARSQESLGLNVEAQQGYQSLAQERSFHGFYAAQHLGLPPNLNHVDHAVEMPDTFDDSGFARVEEFRAIGELELSRQEWLYVTYRADNDMLLALSQEAQNRGWYGLSVHAANHAKAWDAVELRFPQAYGEIFQNAAKQTGLPKEQIMAISRRESAFFPWAQSGVGARGLMQVMPSTARAEAKRLSVKYRKSDLFEPDYNVFLGSNYFKRLLAQFDGSRPKALAGYNAGPNRVTRWSEGDLAVDQWIDSLPFKETREYVRAILAYTVIYQAQNGVAPVLLTEAERQMRY